MLTEQTRYRVTGAVFLVALAIILFPMLFDGDGIEPLDLPNLPRTSIDVALVENPEPPPDITSTTAARDGLRAEIDREGYRRETGTKLGEPVLSVDPDPRAVPAQAWAVQVASFAQHENAVALRDQLRDDGYDALLSRVKRGREKRTRVAVGPMINRDDAVSLKDELANRYELDALVVRFGY